MAVWLQAEFLDCALEILMDAATAEGLRGLPVEQAILFWDERERWGKKNDQMPEVVNELVCADLYYLLVRVCGRVDMLPCIRKKGFVDNQFAFERCREVEAYPNGVLDFWSR